MTKGLLVAVAALAVTSMAAPAGAAEFSYGGFMRFNYQTGNPGTVSFDGGETFYGFTEPDNSVSFMEYRIRQFFNLKVNDHVTVNTKLEWNSFFGDQGGLNGANGDLQVGATGPIDVVGGTVTVGETELRIKHAFVRFDLPGLPVTFTVGQQDFSTPKAIISVEDYGGVKATVKALGGEHELFWARLRDTRFEAGADDADWFGFVPSFTFGEVTVSPHLSWLHVGQAAATAAGFTALAGIATDSLDVYFYGVDSSGKLGPVGFTADLIFQQGDLDGTGGSTDLFSYILDVSASLAVGPGTLTVKGMYSPGDDNPTDGDADAWQQIIATDLGWSPFFHDGADNFDFVGTVLPGVADGGIMAVGAEFALTPMKDLTVTPNVYYLMAAEDVNASGGTNTDDLYGVEAGVQAIYRVWDAVDILAQFDYLFAGDVFEDAAGRTEDAWRLLVGPRISW